MPTQTFRQEELQRMLTFYADSLFKKFGDGFLTATKLHMLEQHLVLLQKQQQKRETNAIWKLPVKLLTDKQRHLYDVALANPDDVEIV